jgi:hypothetical protein
MSRNCNTYIRKAMEMARKLTILADEADASCEDDGCSVMSGIIRDCAYKIRNRAEHERDARKVLGMWDEDLAEHRRIVP